MKIPEQMKLQQEERILQEREERNQKYLRYFQSLERGDCNCPTCSIQQYMPSSWAAIKQTAE